MDLRRLEYFLAVVEHGRVTSAAAALHVAQPSLSQAIRALERDLGVELFHRAGRGLTPTSAGLALIEPARRALQDLAVARAVVTDVVDLAAGWLEVAACDLLIADPLAAALAAFHHRHAGVPVRVHEARDEDDLIRRLVEGRCELALAYLPVAQAGLTVTPLGGHEVWALMPPGTDVPAGPLPLAALAGMSVVDSLDGPEAVRSVAHTALRRAGVTLPVSVRSRHAEAVVPLVTGGAGMAFGTLRYAEDAAGLGAVVRPLDPPLICPFGLLHRDGALSPAARGFVAVLSPQPSIQH